MTTQTRALIDYEQQHEWTGYTLSERVDGLWLYEQWSNIQGCMSGRKVVIEAPADWSVDDEADMDTLDGCDTKVEVLRRQGHEVRCLRRGSVVQ